MAIYAVSDLHGCLDAYKKIKKYIKPEDTVYCLGDCGDRGPEPWETIKAVAKDKQFIYLMGNHEDMLVKAARECLNMDFEPYTAKQRLLASNGGMDTLDQLMQEENVEGWISYLARLPRHATYTNSLGQEIFLCHAGCTFWLDGERTYDLLWDRLHYYDNFTLFKPIIVVHGHTYMGYIAEDLNLPFSEPTSAFRYAGGFKYCIDAGIYHTGKCVLLNLDTFESIHFDLND